MLNESHSISPLSASEAPNAPLKAQILDLSRQNQIGALSPWFSAQLDTQIAKGRYKDRADLVSLSDFLVSQLATYRKEAGVSTCVLGMSGGVDSALTAALFKKAGWKVIGVTMPIHQAQSETDRGVETINALGLDGHVHADLSDAYDMMLTHMQDGDLCGDLDTKAIRVRKGNVRARCRMITLYNLASKNNGLVASTDNLSEMGGSFFSLHGDVGDVSPIQSLMKSWEVPYLARLNGVPESTVRATPTDGLGIDAGDEAQLGCSYLEWDLLVAAMADAVAESDTPNEVAAKLSLEGADQAKLSAVMGRMRAGWFKRHNPVNLPHPFEDRYGMLARIDRGAFIPKGLLCLV